MIIYKAVNKINGKAYIGQTIRGLDERIREHKYAASKRSHNLPFHNAVASYGFENFDFYFVDKANNIEELNKKEEFYINKFNSLVPNGYNLDSGGKNKIAHEETKKKQSEFRKKLLSDKINHPNYGKRLSDETCKKISMAAKGRVQSEESKKKNSESHIGEKNHFFGKTHSDESKAKISKSRAGKKNPNLGISKRRKVICLDTNIVYDSVKIASENFNISRSAIAQCARGELKQAKGFRFSYL